MANFLTKIFGTHSSHELKKIYPIADKVDALEEQFKKLTDDELRAKTDEFKQRYQNGETLDQLLPEAFATCREAAWRVLGMRHYRVPVSYTHLDVYKRQHCTLLSHSARRSA